MSASVRLGNNKQKFKTSIAYHNEVPRIPVECKYLIVDTNTDLFDYQENDEERQTLELCSSVSDGINIDLALPEVGCVPHIEPVESYAIDDIIFGVVKRTPSAVSVSTKEHTEASVDGQEQITKIKNADRKSVV